MQVSDFQIARLTPDLGRFPSFSTDRRSLGAGEKWDVVQSQWDI